MFDVLASTLRHRDLETGLRHFRALSMLFAVIFTDKPGLGEVRKSNLQAHIEWLEQNRDLVPIGGSLRHRLGEPPIGGLWIAEADTKEQLEELIKADPFYIAGLREKYEILHWSKANPERQVRF